jgi:hypothetical protein
MVHVSAYAETAFQNAFPTTNMGLYLGSGSWLIACHHRGLHSIPWPVHVGFVDATVAQGQIFL